MGSHAGALGVALAAALAAGGCATVARTPAEELAWARWTQCDRFPGVRLVSVTPAGDLHAEGSEPGEFARWEACMFLAHRDQARRAAAARPRPAFTPTDGWSGPVCRQGATPVHTAWDREVIRTYDRLAAVADADLPRDRGLVIVDDLGEAAAAVCGDARRFTIAVSGRVLHDMREWPARTVLIARFIAHELAHVALGHLALRDPDVVAIEREAEELAAFYLERAGTPCRDWVDVIGITWGTPAWPTAAAERAAIASACELARRGERPPRRITAVKEKR